MKTRVTNVSILNVKPNKGLVALASCVIDDKLYIGSIGIYTCLSGRTDYRITFPTKIVNGKSVGLCYPINTETFREIEAAIVAVYKEGISSY